MRLYELYDQLDNEKCAVYVLSDTDFEILYMNKKGEELSTASGNAGTLLTSLCGRKNICSDCPLNTELTGSETYVGETALCSFAKVSFSAFMADEGRVIISRWQDDETEKETGKGKAKDNGDMLSESGLFELDEALENLGNNRDTLDSILLTYYRDGEGKSDVIRNAYETGDIKRLRIEVHGLKSASYIVGLKAFGDRSKQFEYACRAIEAADAAAPGTADTTEFEACGRVFSSADRAGSMEFIAGNLDEYLADFNSILELLKDYFKDRIESPTSSDVASEAISSTSSPSGKELIIDKSLIPDSVREKLVSASEALSVYDLDNAQSELEAALSLTASNNSNNISNNNDPASSDRQLTTILSSAIGKSLERINSFDYDGAANILNKLI
ncbi:MAG: hypothetical protein II694_04990 [Lachnospiraceae bacterium]|nr:hypothetical protein [Lachnospiraceae bacterium]